VIKHTKINKKAVPIQINMMSSNIFLKNCGTMRSIKNPKKVIDQSAIKIEIQVGL
jgi:hypothetical protein